MQSIYAWQQKFLNVEAVKGFQTTLELAEKGYVRIILKKGLIKCSIQIEQTSIRTCIMEPVMAYGSHKKKLNYPYKS